jgi:hypothetical protein
MVRQTHPGVAGGHGRRSVRHLRERDVEVVSNAVERSVPSIRRLMAVCVDPCMELRARGGIRGSLKQPDVRRHCHGQAVPRSGSRVVLRGGEGQRVRTRERLLRRARRALPVHRAGCGEKPRDQEEFHTHVGVPGAGSRCSDSTGSLISEQRRATTEEARPRVRDATVGPIARTSSGRSVPPSAVPRPYLLPSAPPYATFPHSPSTAPSHRRLATHATRRQTSRGRIIGGRPNDTEARGRSGRRGGHGRTMTHPRPPLPARTPEPAS